MSHRSEKEPSRQEKSPTEIILEIRASLHPPLPEPPEDATWVNKKEEERTPEENKAAWDFAIGIQRILAQQADKEPGVDHPRYWEYQAAMQRYKSYFRP